MKSAGIQNDATARVHAAKASSLGVAIVLALAAIGQAHAIGLGAIEVKSQLGKPFVAEIPVTLSTPDEATDLSVRLASPEAFARVGLQPPGELSANLTFTLIKNASGQQVIRITTPQPMTDPYVSFLLEADWGRGKMVREYTALLDPPRTTAVRRVPIMGPVVQSTPLPRPVTMPPPPITQPSAAPMPVPVAPVAHVPPPPVAPQRAVVNRTAPDLSASKPATPAPGSIMDVPPAAPLVTAQPKPVPPQPQPMQPAPPPEVVPPPPEPLVQAPPPQPMRSAEPMPQSMPEPLPLPVEPMPMAVAGPKSYTVALGDTLSRIAAQTRPDVSLNRMMIALQRANPDAFIGQNINLLKSGSVLRIPPNEEAQTLSADEANLLVQQQVESWRQASRPQLQANVDTDSSKSALIDKSADVTQHPASVDAKPAAKAKAKATIAKVETPKSDSTDDASAAKAKTTQPAQVAQAHLEIMAPTGKGARGNQTGASEGGSGSELRAELAQTKENLAARTAEIGELKSRLSDMEKMQQDNQKLLSMKDSKLAEMQQRLAELESKQTVAVTPAANADAGPAGTPVDTTASGTTDSATVPAADATAMVPPATNTSATAPTTPAAPASAPTSKRADAESPTQTPWYLRPLVLIGGGLLLLGGLLALLLRGRRPAEPMPSRYNATALAATMQSARAAHDDDLDDDGDPSEYDDEPEFDDVGVDDEPMDNPVADSVAVPGAPVPDVQRGSRPYWSSAYDVDSSRAVESAAGEPDAYAPVIDEPAPTFEPDLVVTPVAASVAPPVEELPHTIAPDEPVAPPAFAEDVPATEDDWNLDTQSASATAITAQHPAIPNFDAEDQSVATKIELARAYIDIGDLEGARGMLEEVLMEGTDTQREDAFKLLETLD